MRSEVEQPAASVPVEASGRLGSDRERHPDAPDATRDTDNVDISTAPPSCDYGNNPAITSGTSRSGNGVTSLADSGTGGSSSDAGGDAATAGMQSGLNAAATCVLATRKNGGAGDAVVRPAAMVGIRSDAFVREGQLQRGFSKELAAEPFIVYKKRTDGRRGVHHDVPFALLVAGLAEICGTGTIDITDVIICNIVARMVVGESGARAALSSMRVLCGKAFGALPQLEYEKAATDQIVARAKSVKKIQPKYEIPVDLGGGESCMWMQIVFDNEEGSTLPDSSGKKMKVKRDTALVLRRHDAISRSDCEVKHSHTNVREFRAYSVSGVLQEQQLVSERLDAVVAGEGGWLEFNYRDPKDPLKKGIYSTTVTVRPLRLWMIVNVNVPWLSSIQRVGYLCSVRQDAAYWRCMEARGLDRKVADGHSWVHVKSSRVDLVLEPLKASSIGSIVQKYATRGGITMGNKSEDPGVGENKKVAGHFLRGHAGSVAYTLASECGATWDPMLCVARARHTIASFMKSYCRNVVRRLKVAFEKHPKKIELRFEEASRL